MNDPDYKVKDLLYLWIVLATALGVLVVAWHYTVVFYP